MRRQTRLVRKGKSISMEIFHNDWGQYLADEIKQPYYQQLRQFLISEYQSRQIYPDMYAIFNALHYTSYEDTKVVILGQDPYHGPGQAHGLSFSVLPGVQPPPSLVNIFKELRTDLGCQVPNNGCLKRWAEQGVLLLNTVLHLDWMISTGLWAEIFPELQTLLPLISRQQCSMNFSRMQKM